MNPIVLQKCLDELKKDKPDLSYIRGMLETILEMSPGGGLVRQVSAPQTLNPPQEIIEGVDNATTAHLYDTGKVGRLS